MLGFVQVCQEKKNRYIFLTSPPENHNNFFRWFAFNYWFYLERIISCMISKSDRVCYRIDNFIPIKNAVNCVNFQFEKKKITQLWWDNSGHWVFRLFQKLPWYFFFTKGIKNPNRTVIFSLLCEMMMKQMKYVPRKKLRASINKSHLQSNGLCRWMQARLLIGARHNAISSAIYRHIIAAFD